VRTMPGFSACTPRHFSTISLANRSICALVIFGRPPSLPFVRAAATFAGDLDLPPSRPSKVAASEIVMLIPNRLGVTDYTCDLVRDA